MNAARSTLLDEAPASWASWMVEMAWQVALLVILLALISVPLRRRSATLPYALWLLIVVRLVLPPGFAFPTGSGAQSQVVARVDHERSFSHYGALRTYPKQVPRCTGE